jgi:hypothetical protein
LLRAIISVEDFAKLPDASKAAYQPDPVKDENGKVLGHLLHVEPVDGFSLDNVGGIRNSFQQAAADRADLRKKLKAFEGLDPDQARVAIDQVERFKRANPEEKAREQIEAHKKELDAKWTKEVQDRDSRISHLSTQISKHLVVSAATAAIVAAKGKAILLLPHVERQVRVVEDNGDFVARVVDDKGNVRITLKPGSTAPMGIDELVEEMRTSHDFASAFEGSGAYGTGQPPPGGGGGTGGKTMHRSVFDAKTPGEQMTFVKTGGRVVD